jgi:hypothetical protein
MACCGASGRDSVENGLKRIDEGLTKKYLYEENNGTQPGATGVTVTS